ncbi:MAG TPA: SDR family oxidoreductase [Chthonomonadaceae bacterium]|nr:SDR family oxidoreductase [Chthonomonadaceae bacterium]
MPKHILITGGAGFIGSHLVRAFLADGNQIRVLDNFSTGSRQNLTEVEPSIEVIEGDIRNAETCAEACQGIETLYHLAALGSVPRSIEDPMTTNAVNVQGTLNLLVAARDAGVRRFVFSSSSSVYGDTPTLPKQETMRPSPRSPYAVSKLAGEEYCRAFSHAYDLETVSLRYFNVFGPRQNPYSQYAAVIPRFVSALQEERQPILYGDGSQSRDFTYVANVVEANRLAGQAPGVTGEVFNIARGEQIAVKQVLAEIAAILHKEYTPQYQPMRVGDVRHSLGDISAARERLHYNPEISFSEGLAQCVCWYVAQATTEWKHSFGEQRNTKGWS